MSEENKKKKDQNSPSSKKEKSELKRPKIGHVSKKAFGKTAGIKKKKNK